jgi:endonuclease IV
MNSSLVLRLFEYIKENPALTDVEIHKMVDTAHKWNEKYHILNMDAYQSIITGVSPPY